MHIGRKGREGDSGPIIIFVQAYCFSPFPFSVSHTPHSILSKNTLFQIHIVFHIQVGTLGTFPITIFLFALNLQSQPSSSFDSCVCTVPYRKPQEEGFEIERSFHSLSHFYFLFFSPTSWDTQPKIQ